MVAKKSKSAAKKQRTIIGAVIDRSGSMQSKTMETISGYNAWLQTQKDVDTDDAYIVVTFFGDGYTVSHLVPINLGAPLSGENYVPDGFTPLLDAVMATILAMEAEAQPGDRFLVNILTDGAENASRQTTLQKVQTKIQELQATGQWTFTYQGCEADAWDQARSIGINQGNFQGYQNSGVGTRSAYEAQANATVSYRSSAGGQSVGFYNDPADDADVPAPATVVDSGQVIWTKPSTRGKSNPRPRPPTKV